MVLTGDQQLSDPAVVTAVDRIFRTALSLGGTVSGEHGVGVLKREWMRTELGEDVD